MHDTWIQQTHMFLVKIKWKCMSVSMIHTDWLDMSIIFGTIKTGDGQELLCNQTLIRLATGLRFTHSLDRQTPGEMLITVVAIKTWIEEQVGYEDQKNGKESPESG